MKQKKTWLVVSMIVALFALTIGTASAAETGKTPAEPGAQPWMVGLIDSSSNNAHDGHFCGGSLIAPEWVLTAAHCLEGSSPSDVDVVIGRYTLSSDAGERIPVAEIAIHPGYTDYADGEDNDIALMRLERAATVGTPITLVTEANEYVDDPGTLARVTGWGVLSENGESTPDQLHGVNIPVVTQAACQNVYGQELLDDTICAGLDDGGADSCYGDSGGPLVSNDANGNAVQIGIVSWGEECGASGSYGVYVRLTEYDAWITDILNGGTNYLDSVDFTDEGSWDDSEWEEDWSDEDGWEDDWADDGWEDDGWEDDWSDDDWSDDEWSDDEWEDDEWLIDLLFEILYTLFYD